jgi:hypothetical protein
MMMRKIFCFLRQLVYVILLLAGASILASTAMAEEADPVVSEPEFQDVDTSELKLQTDKYWVSLGVFFADFGTSARLDADNGLIGTSVDLEDDLGMDSNSKLLMVQAGLYLNQRWRFEAEHLDHKRASVTELKKSIEWGGQEIEAGVNAVARFELNITRLAFGYDLYQEDDYRFGVTLGLHWMKSFAGIQGEGTISGSLPVTDPGFTFFDFEFDADTSSKEKIPLPNVGVYGYHVLGEHWRLEARVDFFKLSLGEWGGEFLSTTLDLRYFLNNGFYAGAGIQYMVINVDYDTRQWEGRIHYRHFGPRLEFGLRF